MADRREDVFSRTEYRRVIAWPERIRREAPFLEWALREAPARTILDVGCGTGSLAALLARRDDVRARQARPVQASEELFRPTEPTAIPLPGSKPVESSASSSSEPARAATPTEPTPPAAQSPTNRLLEAKRRAQRRRR